MDWEDRSMHPGGYEWQPMDLNPCRRLLTNVPSRRDRWARIMSGYGKKQLIDALPIVAKCAPKCAPKVHGAVRATASHRRSTGMTLASMREKTRIS